VSRRPQPASSRQTTTGIDDDAHSGRDRRLRQLIDDLGRETQ
jgi:hypothetical protein